MTGTPLSTPQDQSRSAFFTGLMAYVMWGFFPIYFKLTEEASALEILAHRVFWSVPFALLIILARRQIAELIRAFVTPKIIGLLTLSSFFIAINWGLYIWAIQQDFILQASLGYYINPLLYVIVGVAAFGETLKRAQIFAVALAACGVAVLTFYGGQFPWISLILAASFTAYGVIRKQVDVGSVPGLMIETLLLLLPAILYLHYMRGQGTLIFGSGADITALLILAGPLTVLPLVAFAIAARKLRLSTLGILQYVAPTLQFMCGLYYGEAFTTAHAICFACIWAAVAIFSYNALKTPAESKAA